MISINRCLHELFSNSMSTMADFNQMYEALITLFIFDETGDLEIVCPQEGVRQFVEDWSTSICSVKVCMNRTNPLKTKQINLSVIMVMYWTYIFSYVPLYCLENAAKASFKKVFFLQSNIFVVYPRGMYIYSLIINS